MKALILVLLISLLGCGEKYKSINKDDLVGTWESRNSKIIIEKNLTGKIDITLSHNYGVPDFKPEHFGGSARFLIRNMETYDIFDIELLNENGDNALTSLRIGAINNEYVIYEGNDLNTAAIIYHKKTEASKTPKHSNL